jgi:hypothetical protein
VAVTSAFTADKLRARREADTQPTERARDKSQGRQAYVNVRRAKGTALATGENQRGDTEQATR